VDNFAGTLRVADVIVGALLAAGYAEADAARLCWALVSFTLGLTQEQQTSPPESDIDVKNLTEAGAYPALAKVGARLLVHDSFDARFDYGLTRLLHLPPVATRPGA
jgi:TetR/AcrR family tetracycline transcriptional repressor